jgi:hypothetical protein
VVYLQFRNGGANRLEINSLPGKFRENIDYFYHQQTLATVSTALLLIFLPFSIMISPHTTIGNFLASVLIAGSGIRAASYHADIVAHFELPLMKETEGTFDYEYILGVGAILIPLYQLYPFFFARSVEAGTKGDTGLARSRPNVELTDRTGTKLRPTETDRGSVLSLRSVSGYPFFIRAGLGPHNQFLRSVLRR